MSLMRLVNTSKCAASAIMKCSDVSVSNRWGCGRCRWRGGSMGEVGGGGGMCKTLVRVLWRNACIELWTARDMRHGIRLFAVLWGGGGGGGGGYPSQDGTVGVAHCTAPACCRHCAALPAFAVTACAPDRLVPGVHLYPSVNARLRAERANGHITRDGSSMMGACRCGRNAVPDGGLHQPFFCRREREERGA